LKSIRNIVFLLISFAAASSIFASNCWDLTEQFNESENISSTRRLSESEFRNQALNDHRTNPELLAPLSVEPVLYRVDHRPPEMIAQKNGFWGNPVKKQAKSMVDHTRASDGSSTFVSFSHRENHDLAAKSFFRKEIPTLLEINGKTKSIGKSEIDLFFNSNELTGSDSAWFVFPTYQYRVKNAKGVRVTGGADSHEAEVITRGVPLDATFEVRKILVRQEVFRMEGPNGELRETRTAPIYKEDIQFGEWRRVEAN